MTTRFQPDTMRELETRGLYDPRSEHDACGVGLVANIKGVKSHSILTKGLEALINLGHRGACGADPRTGDGAGVLLQMPHEFFSNRAKSAGIELPGRGEYALGMAFLPQNPVERERCEGIVHEIVKQEGQTLLGWRDVPVSPESIGRLAAQVMPVIRQFFVKRSPDLHLESA
ncbi:MAG: glutamate synthase subunit alpha, partial [Chloroflexi bacterium]|nr:glutamate synthase subunit alpha [Chloroflexota bacterium]